MAGMLSEFRCETDFANAAGVDLAVSTMRQLLGTEPGELPWNLTFGVPLRDLLHIDNDAVLPDLVEARIRSAAARYLPTYRLAVVKATRIPSGKGSQLQDALHVEVSFYPPGAPTTSTVAVERGTA